MTNINGTDGNDLQPAVLTGNPFSCGGAPQDIVPGASLVGGYTVLNDPLFGNITATIELRAQ